VVTKIKLMKTIKNDKVVYIHVKGLLVKMWLDTSWAVETVTSSL